MKLFLSCYVWGDGYVTKCFDSLTHRITEGSRTMNEQERGLFLRSNARLLLADMQGYRFGFVRGIDTGKTDENGRKCSIHMALEGTSGEVDKMICRAAYDYRGFAKMVRRMVVYQDAEYELDWDAFQKLADTSGDYGNRADTSKAVALLVPEPSVEYFLKNCGMNWKSSDIAVKLRSKAYSIEMSPDAQEKAPDGLSKSSEGRVEMNLFFYCPSPSIGWTLKQIDDHDGSVLAEASEARGKLLPVTLSILDNYGCKMALFRENSRDCFLIKEVKADKPNQYGQLKTVTLIAESTNDPALVRQLAAYALLDPEGFNSKLLDCVTITAGITGFSIKEEKLRELLDPLRTVRRLAGDASRQRKWEKIVKQDKKPYTFLVLSATREYFENTTGMSLDETQVYKLFPEEILEKPCQPLVLEDGTDFFHSQEKAASDEQDLSPEETAEEAFAEEFGKETPEHNKKTAWAEDDEDPSENSIDLLDYPAFKIAVCVLAVVILAVIIYFVYRYYKK